MPRVTETATSLSDTFAPQESARWFIPAMAFSNQSGSPALGTVGTYWKAYLLDAAASEVLTTTVSLPEWVATVHVDIWWTNAGAGSGGVRWRLSTLGVIDGDNLAGTTIYPEQTVTAPAQGYLKVTRFSDVAVSDGLLLSPGRIATHGGDTLANDCGLLGVAITVATTTPLA